jgi:uncharacterized ferritin-like protein (DUF455 family)
MRGDQPPDEETPPPTLRSLALRVLHGTTLEEKLVSFDRYDDTSPGDPIVRPAQPGRPSPLRLDAERERVPFPGVHELDRPGMRGRVLHFFANHELLAAELMALALLRFPDAPPAFRRGLVQTLRDEQRHLALYLDRMRDDGVELGTIPVSSFFWDTLADVATPLHFAAGMSLTLEQANLDFARYYADAFRTVGDDATAAVLDRVWEDEIRHVGHGRAFFEAGRGDQNDNDLFDAWRERLVWPLTPARARGRVFDVEARQRAGLDASYIERVRVWGETRGRPPVVHLFDPLCDDDWACGGEAVVRAPARRLARDLELLPLVLAGVDDVVLVRRLPSSAHRARLADVGVAVAGLQVRPEDDRPAACQHPHVGGLRPWGWGPRAARVLGGHVGALLDAGVPLEERVTIARACNRKSFAAEVGQTLADAWDPEWMARWGATLDVEPSVVARTVEEVRAAAARGWVQGQSMRCKSDHGTSGRGQRVLRSVEDADAAASWLQACCARGAVVVERERERVADLSGLGVVDEDGTVRFSGVTRFLADGRGHYRGTVVGRAAFGVGASLTRFLHGDGVDPRYLRAALGPVVRRCGERLGALGYRGPFGVDALVERQGASYRLRPLVEINARTTMGHVALALRPRLAGGVSAFFVVARVPRGDTPASFAGRLTERAPCRMRRAGAGGGIVSGGVVLTDAEGAEEWIAVLSVARTAEGAMAPLREAGLAVSWDRADESAV